MKAAEMYSVTVANLRRSVEQHDTPSGNSSVKAFCEAYGFDRSNLTHVFNEKQEMSVGLFMRLTGILSGKPVEMPEGVERWSLRTWLQVDSFAIQQAMYTVNFS